MKAKFILFLEEAK